MRLSEIKLQRSRTRQNVSGFFTKRTYDARKSSSSYLGAHLSFESHPRALRCLSKRTEMLGPRVDPSYSGRRWREHGPRFGGNCPTRRVQTSCVSKMTTPRTCPCIYVYQCRSTCFPQFSTI